MEFIYDIFDVPVSQGIAEPTSTSTRKRIQTEVLQVKLKQKNIPIYSRGILLKKWKVEINV